MTNLLARNFGSDEPPSAEDSILLDAVKAILTTDSDTRGTVASLASEIDDVAQQGTHPSTVLSYPDIVFNNPAGTRFSLSPASLSSLDLEQQKHLLHYYRTGQPSNVPLSSMVGECSMLPLHHYTLRTFR